MAIKILLKRSINILFSLFMGILMFLIIIAPYKDFFLRQTWQMATLPLLLIGILFICTLFFSINEISKKKFFRDNIDKWMIYLTIVSVPIQCYIIYSYYIPANWWDVGNVFSDAVHVANGEITLLDNAYYSIYPNNMFIVNIFSKIISFARLFGITNDYFVLVVVQSILCGVTGILIYKTVTYLFDERYGVLAYAIYLVTIFISPNIHNVYSDAMGLIFPISIFSIFIKWYNTRRWYWGIFMTILTVVGFNIKPQTAIVFIAIIICVSLFDVDKIKRKFVNLVIIMLVFIVFLGFIRLSNNQLGYELDKSQQLPWTHWLVMGHNLEKSGSYNHSDFEIAMAEPSYEKRQELLVSRFIYRITNMSIIEMLNLYAEKLSHSFTEGTFGMFIYGINFDVMSMSYDEYLGLPSKNMLSPYTRQIFSKNGQYFNEFAKIVQSLWIITILLSFIGSFNKRMTIYQIVVMLAIIGIGMFTLLFESGSRYTFTYVPLFIVTAMYGMHYIEANWRYFIKNKKE